MKPFHLKHVFSFCFNLLLWVATLVVWLSALHWTIGETEAFSPDGLPACLGAALAIALYEAVRGHSYLDRLVQAWGRWRHWNGGLLKIVKMTLVDAIAWGAIFFLFLSWPGSSAPFSERWPHILVLALAVSLFNVLINYDRHWISGFARKWFGTKNSD